MQKDLKRKLGRSILAKKQPKLNYKTLEFGKQPEKTEQTIQLEKKIDEMRMTKMIEEKLKTQAEEAKKYFQQQLQARAGAGEFQRIIANMRGITKEDFFK